ncbi:hypothetical protein HNQ72_001754 [Rhizobium wenxiniae]|uniref:Exopolysaccharide biosynthesis protein n=1 Tax=Rhizobium wenxiniae TaxID=1737357 RepID=A0A7X0CZZ3_9HYPH|nr:DUF6030 family protein [Rhizobium wenxiniae]MBB6161936.1 hypothetical protein [Rhizobium wenxiniae]
MLILAVITAVAATVLFANDQRNLKTFSLFLGIRLPVPATSVATVPTSSDTAKISKPISRWPWPGFTTTPGLIEANPTPADMCSRQAAGAQEIPAFAESEQRGWECSMLRDGLGANRSASLFLQARGSMHEPADNIRVKFNLASGKLDGELATQALAFFRLATAMPRDPALSEVLAKMLTTQTDFYFYAGYQGLTFRQELGDPGRYNLIGTDRTSKIPGDHPRLWPTEQKMDMPTQATKTARIPRLLTLPAVND